MLKESNIFWYSQLKIPPVLCKKSFESITHDFLSSFNIFGEHENVFWIHHAICCGSAFLCRASRHVSKYQASVFYPCSIFYCESRYVLRESRIFYSSELSIFIVIIGLLPWLSWFQRCILHRVLAIIKRNSNYSYAIL